MSEHYKKALKELHYLKKTYDSYAGTLIRLRDNVPVFSSSKEISSRAICNCFSAQDALYSSYPARTEHFFGHLLVTCQTCLGSFIPSIGVDLEKYYESDYANLVQKFRVAKHGGSFFSSFRGSEAYSRFARRADLLLELGNDRKNQKILDFGSGVGVLLDRSAAVHKFAIEPDTFAQKILNEELDVKLLESDSTRKNLNVIYFNHVLEHLPIYDLKKLLENFRKMLAKNGAFVIAVPDGANQTEMLLKGERKGVRFEPHTINFSLAMLLDLLDAVDMHVTHASQTQSVKENWHLYDSLFDGENRAIRVFSGDLVVRAIPK